DAAQRIGEAEAGRRQRLESRRGEDPGRADIPGIGNDESAGTLMQRAEPRHSLRLAGHGRPPWDQAKRRWSRRAVALSMENARAKGASPAYWGCVHVRLVVLD